jgi:hypothetical protein
MTIGKLVEVLKPNIEDSGSGGDCTALAVMQLYAVSLTMLSQASKECVSGLLLWAGGLLASCSKS